MRDEEFLTEALKRGLIKPEQADAVKKTQAEIVAKGLNIDLPQIMIMKGMLTTSQVDAIKTGEKPKGSMAFGAYEIVGKLGEGGMGIVYKAIKNDAPDKPVALKILHPRATADKESVARFKREADILIKMQHPNIMRGYDSGEINGRTYIAMELLNGKILTKWIQERGKVEEKFALKIALDIAHGLEFIHSLGLVHRDIKPDNLMITEEGVSKLMDLGLAKSAGQEVSPLTAPGMAIGTPMYMSLEHIQGDRDLDIRTDIYGLGATLYHALTGVKPFEGENPFEVMKAKIERPVPDARQARKEVSANMSALLQVMMAKDRKDRHQTPQELVSDIRKVLQGEAPDRRPTNAPRRPTVIAPPGSVPQPMPKPVSAIPQPVKPPTRRTQMLHAPRQKHASWPFIILLIVVLVLGAVVGFIALKKKGFKFGALPRIIDQA